MREHYRVITPTPTGSASAKSTKAHILTSGRANTNSVQRAYTRAWRSSVVAKPIGERGETRVKTGTDGDFPGGLVFHWGSAFYF